MKPINSSLHATPVAIGPFANNDDAAMRCVLIPDDPAEPTISQDCVGNYEYMPDGSWKGTGTCTDNYPEGKISLTWEEGSQLKEYTYTKTSGTGKYQGVKGGGTYMYQILPTRSQAADTRAR